MANRPHLSDYINGTKKKAKRTRQKNKKAAQAIKAKAEQDVGAQARTQARAEITSQVQDGLSTLLSPPASTTPGH